MLFPRLLPVWYFIIFNKRSIALLGLIKRTLEVFQVTARLFLRFLSDYSFFAKNYTSTRARPFKVNFRNQTKNLHTYFSCYIQAEQRICKSHTKDRVDLLSLSRALSVGWCEFSDFSWDFSPRFSRESMIIGILDFTFHSICCSPPMYIVAYKRWKSHFLNFSTRSHSRRSRERAIHNTFSNPLNSAPTNNALNSREKCVSEVWFDGFQTTSDRIS